MSEEITPEQVDAGMAEVYAAMLDLNADAIKGIRQQIRNIEVIRDAYLLQADRCGEIIMLLASGAAIVAESTGDLLLNEFGFEKDMTPVAEDEDDDDEED